MRSNWRHTIPWESHRGETNDWHRENTENLDESCVWQTSDSNWQGMTREEVDTSSWWHTADSWDSHRGEKNGWHGESTENLHESCAWRTHGSSGQGHTKTLDDLEAQVQGMHDRLVALAARMQQTEDALLTAKEKPALQGNQS